MTGAFPIVVVVVCVLGVAISLTRAFQPFAVLREVGRTGAAWIDHPDDHTLEEQLAVSDVDPRDADPPILHRRLRGRP